MGDFYQSGEITTLHRLGDGHLDRLEAELERSSRNRPIALVLPTIFSELDGEALPHIIREIAKVNYIGQIVVTLGRFDEKQFKYAQEFFSILPQDVKLIWNDGERMKKLYYLLDSEGISAGPDGKGRSAWMAYGYILAKEKCRVIVLHDCDILNYNREFLARLCYPVTNHHLDFEFCKGYYSRVTDRMYGRTTRLFVTPLVRSLEQLLGKLDFLEYLDSFRYPLAGEFSMVADLARINRIPGDWGLEVGVLAEIYKNCSKRRICQVDLCETYEHKHQALSAEDPSTGLMKMAIDISKCLFRTLASSGAEFPEGFFRSLKATYFRTAHNFIDKYQHDAIINGLQFDRHQEANAVEAFTKGLSIAGERFMEDPTGMPLIPNWNRITSAVPNFFDLLAEAVDADNK
ncbi:MAG: glycosyl transferase [Candidatus Brocadiales bacterium]